MQEVKEHKHKKVVDMFPKLVLDQLINEYEHVSSEALVEIVLKNMPDIENRPKEFSLCKRIRSLLGAIIKILPSETAKNRIGKFLDDDGSMEMPDLRERMECLVCSDNFLVHDMVFCDGSQLDEGASSSATHSFCKNCLGQHAKAATEDMPMARGGIGLKCMTTDCRNPIIFPEIERFVPTDMIKKLGDRSAEESVAQAGLNHLERCRKCNCGMEMNAPASVVRVFKCPDCKYQFCRSCDRPWPGHVGTSCEMMDKQEKKDGAQRLLEKRLSEAVVRKCPKCGLAFVKNGGCNMMRCRCGMSQCYICREDNIGYSHFCTVYGKCLECKKTCTQWEDPSIRDRDAMDEIRRGKRQGEAAKSSENQANAPSSRFFFF